jgi:magnesium transporter
MVKYYKLENGRVASTEKENAQIVLLVNPDQEQKNLLIHKHKIDEHTLASAFDIDELARLEYEDDHTAVIFKRPKSYSASDQFQFRVSSSGIFLFDDTVLVIADNELPLTDERRFSKLESLKMFVLKLLNYSIYHFNEHLRIIGRINDDLETKLIRTVENEYLLYMFSLNKSLVYYLNAISSNETLLHKLQLSRSLAFTEAEREMLDDIVIENSQCRRQAEIYSNILSGMMDARASIVSNNLNSLMKTLNVITLGVMFPTLVVSTFSMNIHYPFQMDSPFTFWFIMALVSLSCLGFVWVWKIKKW